MIFGLFTLVVALTISAVAAYYSIAGLCAIFAAAVVPIIIMGAALELGKITATVWLHKYWHRANIQFKLYLIPAIVVLMLVTSMGIFGFLSKAHMDQSVTVGDSSAKVAILDEKIATEKSNIESAKKALQQMDSQVDQMLSRTTDDKGTNRAVQIRKQQASERKNLQKEITAAQQTISQLQNERAPLAAQSRKIEAEVGPIKYIAALIYGDNPDANLLERAVRWVIILLVFVFDPLALVLILAAEQTIEWARADRRPKKVEGWHQEWVPDTENPWHNEPAYEPDNGPLTDEQYTKIEQEADVNDAVETEKFFEDGKDLAKSIDANDGNLPDDYIKTQSYLNKPYVGFPHLEPLVAAVEPEEPVPNETEELKTKLDQTEKDLAAAVLLIQEKQQELDQLKVVEILPDATETHAEFGTSFPINPLKGDLFLRVDYKPNKLFKWNGSKWIEIDKISTDRYAYQEEYIKYITEKVSTGEYDFDDLSGIEQDQVLKHMSYDVKRKLRG